jgi:hypothetical protein
MMIKRLLTGIVLGYYGKKLLDDGKLDPLISRAKSLLYPPSDAVAAAQRS